MLARLIRTKIPIFLQTFRFSTHQDPEILTEKPTGKKIIEETIDIKSVKSADQKLTISDMYEIKSKKLGPRNVANFIDKTRITNPNVELHDEFDREVFSKDEFESINPIPVSAKLGPFEVINS
jgi:hypothetical protein